MGKREMTPRERTSRALSKLLRHSADKREIPHDEMGGIKLETILGLPEFIERSVTSEQINDIVETSDKKRFIIYKDDDDNTMVRAAQGHSIQISQQAALQEITLENLNSLNIDIGSILHGTYYKSWELIKQRGLNKMRRLHIHFAKGMPEDGSVVSGMRTTCELIIYLDIVAALNAGLKFYLSENGVVLTPGDNEGYLDKQFFSSVIDRASGNVIPV